MPTLSDFGQTGYTSTRGNVVTPGQQSFNQVPGTPVQQVGGNIPARRPTASVAPNALTGGVSAADMTNPQSAYNQPGGGGYRAPSPSDQQSFAHDQPGYQLQGLMNNPTDASPELQNLLGQGITSPSDLVTRQFQTDANGASAIINGQRVSLPSDIMDQLSQYHDKENTRQQQIAALHQSVTQQQIENGVHGNPKQVQQQGAQQTTGTAAQPQQQLLPINSKNFPGASLQQLTQMRIDARKNGTPGKAPAGTASVSGSTTPTAPVPSGATTNAGTTGSGPSAAGNGPTAPSGTPQSGAPAPGTPPQAGGNGTQPNPTDPTTAGMSAATANLPPEYQALKPFFDNLIATIQAGQSQSAQAAQAELNGGTIDVNGQQIPVQGVKQTYDAAEQKLQDFEAGYTKFQDGIQGMLDKAKADQEQSISEQENAAQQRAQWQAQAQIRQAATDKRQAVDAAIAGEAIKGGWGSSGAAQEISMAGAQFDKKIQDLQSNLGLDQIDIAAKFSAQHVQATQDWTTKTIGLMKDAQTEAQTLEGQSFANMQAKQKAEQSIIDSLVKDKTANDKELATSYLGMAKDMETLVHQDKLEKQADERLTKDTARNFFQWAFVNSDDPTLRQNAADMMTKAGYDMSGVDLTALTPQQQITAMTKTQQQDAKSLYDPSKYADDPEKNRVYQETLSAISNPNMSADLQQAHLRTISNLLDQGKTDEAEQSVRGLAASKLTGKQADDYYALSTGLTQTSDVVSNLQKLSQQGAIRGLYTYKWNDAMRYLNRSQDPTYLDLSSKMAALTAEQLHQLYGSRLTEFEMKSAEHFLPMPQDTVQDALVKIRNLRDLLGTKADTLLDIHTGQGGAGSGFSGSSGSASPPSYDQNFYQNLFKGGSFSPSAPVSSSVQLKGDGLVSVLKQAGFSGKNLQVAYAVARAESAGKVGAIGDTRIANGKWGPSVGLFQIRSLRNPAQYNDEYRDASKLPDPLFNAQAAFKKSNGGTDWSDWSTFKNGSYKQYLPEVS